MTQEQFNHTEDEIEGRNNWRLGMLDELKRYAIPEELAERAVNRATTMIDHHNKILNEMRAEYKDDVVLKMLVGLLVAQNVSNWAESVFENQQVIILAATADKARAVNEMMKDVVEDLMERNK